MGGAPISQALSFAERCQLCRSRAELADLRAGMGSRGRYMLSRDVASYRARWAALRSDAYVPPVNHHGLDDQTNRAARHVLKPGIYRVFWASGGYSLAAIGIDPAGANWIAPINWLAPGALANCCVDGAWGEVDRFERLHALDEGQGAD